MEVLGKNRSIVIVGLAVLLAAAGLYAYSASQVEASLRALTWKTSNAQLTGLSLIPPSVDVKFTVTVTNPGPVDLTLTVSPDLYKGSTLIASLTPSQASAKAGGEAEFSFVFHLDSETFRKWQAASGDASVRGRVSASGGILPATVQKDLSELRQP